MLEAGHECEIHEGETELLVNFLYYENEVSRDV